MNAYSMDAHNALMLRLDEALEHLSWPAARQRQYLTALGVDPSLDELALEFDDALKPIEARFLEFGIEESIQNILVAIDARLTEMSGQSSTTDFHWDWDALDGDTPWSEVRHLAALARRKLEDVDHIQS